jgi:DtxR family transcriptional regulator, Mn-dependent transcriptional regulator
MDKREIEEVLELIWTMREENKSSKKMLLEITNEKNPEKLIEHMDKSGLIEDRGGNIYLTDDGENYAKIIVRRHRLAERLFKDVFKIDEETMEKEACTWEHVLSEDVTESVCSFLGHPRICPHNKPIPPGECCIKYKNEKQVTPLVQPLSNIDVGFDVKIVYILPSLQERLKQLTNFGIIPGTIVSVKQRYPALVIICNETTIALDKEIGSEIYVNLLNGRK